jgi:23S rRNA (adenine1618-N6)-methyltransferase
MGVGFADKAVWSRAARRQAKIEPGSIKSEVEEEPSFGFKIHISETLGGVPGSEVTIRWLKGHDSVLFESFCGMIKRKVED